jgi:two-component system nitrogen regulation response regulator GlnG
MKYRWPGNVRELENLIYRSAVMAQGETILIKDLPQEVVATAGGMIDRTPVAEAEAGEGDAVDSKVAPLPAPVSEGPAEERQEEVLGAPAEDPFDAAYRRLRAGVGTNILEHAEREIIRRALDETAGKQVAAAEILGMTRATLRKRIDQYDLGK